MKVFDAQLCPISDLELVMVDQSTGLVVQQGKLEPGVSSREEVTPCCRLQGQHGTIHTPQARSFTNRKRRKSSRPIYDAVSSSEEQEEADNLILSLLACEVITRMLPN